MRKVRSRKRKANREYLSMDTLEAYKAGRLSAEKTRQVDLIVQDDPLYQEALEGLSFIQDISQSRNRVARAKEILYNRLQAERKRRVPLPTAKLTWDINKYVGGLAAFLVLFLIVWLIFLGNFRDDLGTNYDEPINEEVLEKDPVLQGTQAPLPVQDSLSSDSIAGKE